MASGDPKDTSIVFWTRCVRTGTAADSAAIALRLEVSDTSGFGNLVAKVALEASDRFDRTVRVRPPTASGSSCASPGSPARTG
ncbi:PhoD-like phosphatase N-terminal domain-containing protein [Variovorax sp. CT11-76]